MEDNEIMNYDEMEVVEGEIVADEKPGISTGAAMLIGAGLTIAVTAGVKLVKKGIAAIKAKRAAKKSENEDCDDQETDEVADK